MRVLARRVFRVAPQPSLGDELLRSRVVRRVQRGHRVTGYDVNLTTGGEDYLECGSVRFTVARAILAAPMAFSLSRRLSDCYVITCYLTKIPITRYLINESR